MSMLVLFWPFTRFKSVCYKPHGSLYSPIEITQDIHQIAFAPGSPQSSDHGVVGGDFGCGLWPVSTSQSRNGSPDVARCCLIPGQFIVDFAIKILHL